MFAVDFLAGTVVSAIATIAAIFRFVIIYPIVAGLNLHTGVETAANAAVYMADCFKPPKEEVTV
jgi:mannose/fructose-specific phosphotransferase system component IIA